jgi:hypothetical protein
MVAGGELGSTLMETLPFTVNAAAERWRKIKYLFFRLEHRSSAVSTSGCVCP